MPLVASVVAAGSGNGRGRGIWLATSETCSRTRSWSTRFGPARSSPILGAIVGWYMVLRKQTFAGHTLSVAAFPGAAAATLIGISATVGYFAFCLAAALVIAVASRPSRGRGFSAESAVVGTVQAFVLASGYLFATLYNGLLSGLNNQLFGFTFGITNDQVVTLAAVAVTVLAVLAVIGRRLFFASIDSDVADARGVGVRLLGVVFLLLLGAAAAEASQITGALLVFALAGDAGCSRAAGDRAARRRDRARRADRCRRNVGRVDDGVLHVVPQWFLHHDVCVRRIRRGAPRAGEGVMAPYMQHAALAGTAIAIAAGLIGYFLVLRSQVFTTDALGHVTYTGAMSGLAFAFNPLVGLFAATVAVAGGFAVLGRRARADDVVIGSAFAWVLGLGALFQRLYTEHHSSGNGRAGATYLFGSIFGISATQAVVSVSSAPARASRWRSWHGRCCSPASMKRSLLRAACRCDC